jgi:hypothetical protein
LIEAIGPEIASRMIRAGIDYGVADK